MFGVPYDSTVAHRPGETTRCNIKVPAAHVLLESVDELGRAHSRTRSKFALDAARHKQFHVRAADIDDQDFSLHERPSPEGVRDDSTGRVDPSREDAERSLAAQALPTCWQASIPLFRGQETGTAVAGQISNRALDSWQFVARIGHH